jgi:hypothetical protein
LKKVALHFLDLQLQHANGYSRRYDDRKVGAVSSDIAPKSVHFSHDVVCGSVVERGVVERVSGSSTFNMLTAISDQ